MENSLRKTIGNQLKQCRLSKHLSQIEVADEIGMAKQVLSSYERGVHLPTLEAMIKLADYYECSIDLLIGRETCNEQKLVKSIQDMAAERQKQTMVYELRRFVREKWRMEL